MTGCLGLGKAPDALLKALTTGESWPKCFEKHVAARKELAQRFGKQAGKPGGLLHSVSNFARRNVAFEVETVCACQMLVTGL